MTGFLEEKEGVKSSNRLVFVAGMFWLMAITTLMVLLKAFKSIDASWIDIGLFFGSIAGVLMGGKIVQKSFEKQNNENSL